MALEMESRFAGTLVSCMHVVEHVGLGCHGDPLDANGEPQKAISELEKRVVRPGGVLYFVVPTGVPGIFFNAHRVYAAQSVLGYFEDQFDLEEFCKPYGRPRSRRC